MIIYLMNVKIKTSKIQFYKALNITGMFRNRKFKRYLAIKQKNTSIKEKELIYLKTL